MSKNFEIAQAIMAELKKKSYETLLSMPSPSLLMNDDLTEDVTLEFNRSLSEDETICIELKLRLWELPDQKAKREQQQEQFLKDAGIEFTQEDEEELAECMEELLAEGLVEEAKQPLSHPDSRYVFSGSGFTFDFEKTKDNELILNDWEESERLEALMEETVPWMGKTGLPEEYERQLVRYIRLELGELLVEEDATRAENLEFLGRYTRLHKVCHLPEYHYIWKANNHENLYGLLIEEYDDQGESYSVISMSNEIESILKSGYVLEYQSL